MPTGATGQLGLALPVQGELSGTWGDTVNNGITQYVNVAIAGTLSFAGDGAITLANTTGDATASNIGSTTAQYMVIRITGALTTPKIITAPSYSKIYLVDNAATGSTVSFIRSGQTPPVSIAAGESAFVYFNGTDYIKVTSDLILGGYTTTVTAAGTTTLTSTSTPTQFFTGSTTQTVVLPVAATLILGAAFTIHNNSTGDVTVNSSGGTSITTVTPNTTVTFTCILTSGTDAASWDSDVTGFTSILPVVRGGTGTSSPALVQGTGVTISGSWPNQTINATGTGGTVTGVNVSGGTTGLTTSGGPVTTSGTITLAGTLGTANGGTNLTSFTSGGVVYASSTSALATSSSLTYDGTFTVAGGSVMARFKTGSATDGRIELAYNATDIGYINMPSASLLDIYARSGVSLAFGANGSEGMRLTSTGLGIGTSSPAGKLHVFGNGNNTSEANASAYIGGGSTEMRIYFGVNNSSNYSYIGSYQQGIAYRDLVLQPNGGNVGINTSSPTQKLTVNGSIDLPTVNSYIKGGGHDVIQVDATYTYFYGGTSGVQFRKADNTVDLFNITNVGAVGVGGSNYGTAGQVLTSGGASAAPTWAAAGGGGAGAFVAFSTTGESVFASQGF